MKHQRLFSDIDIVSELTTVALNNFFWNYNVVRDRQYNESKCKVRRGYYKKIL
jgi:hypothetical protein